MSSVGSFSSAATISGGENNAIQTSSFHSTIAGGNANLIESESAYGSMGGGQENLIQSGTRHAAIPGGSGNLVSGSYGMAAGRRAKARHTGSWVWADSTDSDFSSTATNEFAVRATGGVRFVTGTDSIGVPVSGVELPAGSGSWSSLSDRNAKTNFAPVNPHGVLDRLAQVPIQTWNYVGQDKAICHIGPTAQDFASAFNVGEDDRHIAAVDADGVALAAIQGLNLVLKERDARISQLEQRNAILENRLSTLENLVGEIAAQKQFPKSSNQTEANR